MKPKWLILYLLLLVAVEDYACVEAEQSSPSCVSSEAFELLQRELEMSQIAYHALQAEHISVKLERDALHELLTQPDGHPDNASPFESEIIGNNDVAVRTSLIPGAGRGAFAGRHFEAGAMIGEYKCIVVGDDDPTRGQYLTSRFSWNMNETHICDARAFRLYNAPMYVNSIAAESSCSLQNVGMEILPSPIDGAPSIFYVTTKPVLEGEEFLVDYGHDYFIDLAKPKNAPYECNMSPLHVASKRGDFDTVRDRLKMDTQRSEIDSVDADGWTALMLACESGHLKVVKLLVEAGSSITRMAQNSPSRATALHIAVENCWINVVEYLLDQPETNPNIKMMDGLTPLSLAVGYGYDDIARALIQSGADVDDPTEGKEGDTPLILASRHGQYRITQLLLKAGADQRKTNRLGETPFKVASLKGHRRVVEVLVAALGTTATRVSP